MAPVDSLPWQEAQWNVIQRRRAADRLPHALLLTGPEGVGKVQFAERLVRALLCTQPRAGGDACGHCAACQLCQAGTHPDLRRVAPEEPGKAIRIDAVRDLIRYLALKSQFGGYKVATVSPAERLNSASANALLKTLEEPTAQTLLVLSSARPSALPATVRSRCQQVKFRVPEREQALNWLRRQGVESPENALGITAGAPLKAMVLAGSEQLKLRLQLAQDLDRLGRTAADPTAVAARYHQADTRVVLGWLLSYVADMIRLAMVPNSPGLGNSDIREELAGLAAGKLPEDLFRYQDALLSAQWMSETQVNAQLLMEDLFVRWSRLGTR